jgi:hypothetical protein
MSKVETPATRSATEKDTLMNDDQLLTIKEAAEFLRTPVATLRCWRHLGIGPQGFKVGRRVFYWLSDLRAWLDQQHGQRSA